MTNFTSDYLALAGITAILNEGLPLDTIHIGKNPKPFSYFKPSITIDKFSQGVALRTPEIRGIKYSELKRMGYIIIKYVPSKRWFTAQRYAYKLKKIDEVGGYTKKDVVTLSVTHASELSLDISHYIEYDLANRRVRLVGKSISPTECIS